MFNFLNDALKEACVGTGFEGKVNMTMVVDADYYETMYSGNTDIIFTTWGGAAYSPYTMLYQCYCDAADGSGQQMEYGFDTTQIPVTITINGEEFTADLQTWAKWAKGNLDLGITGKNGTVLNGFNTYDAASRAAAFAKLEYAYLSYYTTIPLYYRASAVLLSQQGDYAVKSYLDLIGFGGIQFYTYNYTDAQWADVAGKLTY
jgi:ABC-type oligopeptide transport system substrate-binding subunit